METCGNILLLEALKANRCEYVSSLLDQEVALESRYLPDLYKWQSKNENTLVNLFFGKKQQEIIKQGRIKSSFVRKACRKFLEYKALEEEKNEKKEEENEKEEGERKRKKACTKEDSNIGISDILLWAVIFNRRELAEICWHKGKDKLCR
uniref:TRPM-like domain-containing protein n=1 Tax=Magallana gigas TaxID=29159 RepID=A0A8W8NPP1_MAGGI